MTDLLTAFMRIPLPDGRTLSARLWRPTDGPPVPAILECRPYRGYDLFRALEDQYLPVWAEHGYAVLAVDTAGSGQSTGLLNDEYLASEIDDAVAAIDWCAAQPWCDGKVGLSGMSWSAFTALRVSARRPPALKALALGGVSEDGWRTDIHNLGGALYAARLDWAGVMLQLNALPPDPDEFGPGWKDEWRARLAANRPWIETWLAHPSRDAYWAGKAFALDGPGADLPLLLYAGWADKYATSVLRIAAAWRGPVRTIVGPWEHTLPDLARRRPRIDYLGEALAWWDHWLKGMDTGVLNAPPLRAWIGAPDAEGRTGVGRWIGADWPASPARAMVLVPSAVDRLGRAGAGSFDGAWRLSPSPADPPALGVDRYEDAPGPFDLAGATVLASVAQVDDVEILGQAVLSLTVRPDAAGGLLVARLIDIDPQGRAVRFTTGALNLAFRNGFSEPTPPAPGEPASVVLEFQATAWRLQRGHRLALALSADGWPTLWPDRHGAEVAAWDLALSLPLAGADAPSVAFPEPTRTARTDVQPLKWIDPSTEALPATGLASAAAYDSRSAAHHLPGAGTDYFSAARFELALSQDRREAVAVRVARTAIERPGWSIRVATRLSVASSPDAFGIRWSVRATLDGAVVHQREEVAEVRRSVV